LNSAAGRGNPWLLAAAAATALAALAHLACIAIGPTAYLTMGAGPRMAELAEAGHWYPPVITVVIAGMLFVWSAYALSGAGLIRRLPLLRTILIAITAVFLLRGFARPVLEPHFPGNSETFWFWSSAICLAIGAVHAIGLFTLSTRPG
jgi:hypothetical protein